MLSSQRDTAPCSRPRRLTIPSKFPRPCRRLPARQLPPRPATSPAGLPSGYVRARRAPWLRIDTSLSTSTIPAARSPLQGAEDSQDADGKQKEPHGLVVSPYTGPLSSPLSNCSEVSNPLSPIPSPHYPPTIFRRCPFSYANARQQYTSHRRSISDNALPPARVDAQSNPKCLYPLDWTPQPLPSRIMRPKGHPPMRDAVFAPPTSPYPLALVGVNIIAASWTGEGSSSSTLHPSVRSMGSNELRSPTNWSPFLVTASTTAMAEKNEEAPSLGKGLGDIVKTCGWQTSLPRGLRVATSSSSSTSLPRSRRDDGGLTPLRAPLPSPPFPSRVQLATPSEVASDPLAHPFAHTINGEHPAPQGSFSTPSRFTQILNAHAWAVATSRVFGPTDPRTLAARKEENARRVERANWVERIEASLGRTKGFREWWGSRGQGGSRRNAADGKKVRFMQEHGVKVEGV